MAQCAKCGDTGTISRVEGLAIECECALIRRLAATMPPYIRKAKVCKEHFQLPVLKATKKSVLVKSAWADMKAIIKAVMMLQPDLFVRVTSDREVLDVYLGKKSRSSRGELDGAAPRRRGTVEMEGDEFVYNSIEDLMRPAHLCVLRLNEIGYKNKAAPGALTEALSFRLDRDLPTWIVSDLDKPYGPGSFSYTEAVMDYILTSTVATTIPRIAPRVQFELEQALGLEAPQINLSTTAQVSGTKTLTGTQPVANTPMTSFDPEPIEADPVEDTSEETEKPSYRNRPRPPMRKVQSSDDMDAPKGLGIFGQGVKPSGKMRKG